MNHQSGLAIAGRRKFLGLGNRYGAVAFNHTLDQAAVGLQTEREWDYIQQERLILSAIAYQNIRLFSSAHRHDLIGIRLQEVNWKQSATAFCTAGVRVDPPTNTTRSTVSVSASRSVCRHACKFVQ